MIKPISKKRGFSSSPLGRKITIDGEELHCDDIFMGCISTLLKPMDEYKKFVDDEVKIFLNSPLELRNRFV
jgi:hypothetical protein